MPLSKIDSDSLNSPIAAVDLAYTGTLTGGAGVVNLGSGQFYKDASGNVGIGTSSPNARLTIKAANNTYTGGALALVGAVSGTSYITGIGSALFFSNDGSSDHMILDSSGNLLVGTATSDGRITVRDTGNWTIASKRTGTGGEGHIRFDNANGNVGYIQTSGTSTQYITSSDYRLKEEMQPMTGALAKVLALAPVTYKWKADGSDGQGFIAHELQAVVPECVSGEKDAVDADGNPQYQGIDTSFLVATLTAAIQELKAIVDGQAVLIAAQGAEIAALKGTP